MTKDDQIAAVAEKAAKHFGKIDVLVHSIAFAGRDELSRPYYQTSREGFKNALDISVFSFVALTNAFLPILNPGASVMCLTYYGSVKVAPHYNVMGVAKAALESSTRYLAYDLGPQKIRVNAISAGPIRTLAAAGVGGFRDMYKHFADMSPDARKCDHRRCGQLGSVPCFRSIGAHHRRSVVCGFGFQYHGCADEREGREKRVGNIVVE